MSQAKKISSMEHQFISNGMSSEVWNGRILVVDDEPEIARQIEEILTDSAGPNVAVMSSRKLKSQMPENFNSFNFEVIKVCSYSDALNEVRNAIHKGKPFAMGFFDVMLGGKRDGIDLVKEIQELDAEMYSVFVTAYNDRSIDSINTYLGSDQVSRWDFMNKPFSSSEILQKARNFVSLRNLEVQRSYLMQQMSEINKKVLESERNSSAALVAKGLRHEVGNILTQILGQAEIGEKNSEDEIKRSFARIISGCDRAVEILDRFKSITEDGRKEIEKSPIDLGQLLDEALELLSHQFKLYEIKACIIKRESSVVAIANGTALLQVIINLSINAIQSMSRSGQIDFSISRIGKYAEIAIRDYGSGVKPDQLNKILNPFFTTKEKSGGTGLGLAITKEIVEVEHGGKLIVGNHPIKGFEVKVQLPFKS